LACGEPAEEPQPTTNVPLTNRSVNTAHYQNGGLHREAKRQVVGLTVTSAALCVSCKLALTES
jgi:hypothetical protein